MCNLGWPKKIFLYLVIKMLVIVFVPFMAHGAKQNLIKVEVKAVTQDPASGAPIILLEDKEGEQMLPIWIGFNEARSIMTELEGIPQRRPMTHDLLKTVIHDLQAKVKSVVITDLKDNTFYANIIIERAGSDLTIDSRPSDAIALALRTKSPIFLEPVVLSNAQTIDVSSSYIQERVKEKYGFSFQDLTPSLSEYFKTVDANGVLVSDIQVGSLAESAGLKQGDIILRLNKNLVKNSAELSKGLQKLKEGELIKIDVTRSGNMVSLNLPYSKMGKAK